MLNHLVSRPFRKEILLPIFLCVSLVTTFATAQALRHFGDASISTSQIPERTLTVSEADWPKDVVKIVEINGLQAADFPKGFEIKLKNISDRPIFYYRLAALFTESGKVLGVKTGAMLELSYGNSKFVSLSQAQSPAQEDSSIKAGETITLSVNAEQTKHFFTGLDPIVRRKFMEEGLSRIHIVSQIVNFGDGTGYIGNSAYPVKNAQT